LAPICPHTLTIRPYIIPIEKNVSINFGNSSVPVQVTLDGQKTIQLNKGREITFTKSQKSITIVKTKKIFSEILKEKLGWSV
jgi:NAD+ kinase